ncbi:MAG: bifunctional precorrin-2 dehydrogenase/sirohydrochlorin ferrochelatase, partial [Pseudomonadota bacterium]
MQNYPIFLNLKDQPCLVVGGGAVALRKVRLQIAAGAQITIVAPEIDKDIKTEFGDAIDYQQREFRDEDISGYKIITAATNNIAVNKQISLLAQHQNIPVNVVDDPELCTFITPSIVDRSPVLIAISTGGGAPVLARLLRAKLE